MAGLGVTIQMSKVLDTSLVRRFALTERACNNGGLPGKALLGLGKSVHLVRAGSIEIGRGNKVQDCFFGSSGVERLCIRLCRCSAYR